jgi:AcrR family transcriptional regulator
MSTPDLIWARREPGERRARLTRDQIAATAIALADAEGFEAVSMRRVAGELGAGTMTLYHYVRNKRELMSLMDDAIMGELLVPEGELWGDWREALAAIARRTKASFERHPWVLTALRGVEGGPNSLRHVEQSLAAAARTGLDPRQQLELIAMIDDYVFGYVTRGAAARAHAPEVEELLESVPSAHIEFFESLLRTGDFPHVEQLFGGHDLRQALPKLVELFADQGRFERGLQRLLDGIALEVERED